MADGAQVYAAGVPLLYRDSLHCKATPKAQRDDRLGRVTLPDRPGVATPIAETKLKAVPVSMLDGRALLAQGEAFSLDDQGFVFKHAPSAVQNWQDRDDILHTYFPEVESLVRSTVPGADRPGVRILIFDHALRTGGGHLADIAKKSRAEDLQRYAHASPETSWGPYAVAVHNDATARSGHSRAKDQVLGSTEVAVRYGGQYPGGWGEVRPTKAWREHLFRAETLDHDSNEGKGGEHLILNVWRPLASVENWGLAVLDGRTLSPKDAHPTTLHNLYRTGQEKGEEVVDLDGKPTGTLLNEVLSPLYDQAHRWVYFPQMQPDEALLFKNFDSRRDGRATCGAHTSFKDPRGRPGAHRQSIEVRVLVVFPPDIVDASLPLLARL